jgi:bacterioferritin
MTKEEIIARVNADCDLLRAAAIQYIQHATLLTGNDTSMMAADLRGHAHDDFGQAEMLSDKVALMGGIPSVGVAQIKVSDKSLGMLFADYLTVKSALERWRESLSIVSSWDPLDSLNLSYMEIVRHEEEHLNTISAYLEPHLRGMVTGQAVGLADHVPEIVVTLAAEPAC